MEYSTLLKYHILLQLLPSFIFAVMGAFLSVFFAKMLKQNGRVLKQLEECCRRMDEGFRRMDEGFRKMDEGFRRMDEGFRRMDEGFRRMDEGFRRMDERAEQRHMEVIEFLKKLTELISKGFRDLSRDIN